jgi:hypothetical protein
MKHLTFDERKTRYFNRSVKKLLGSAYSWDQELYYIGNPLSYHWQIDTEKKALSRIDRNWHEATTA